MKIGVILVGRECEDMLEKVLEPFMAFPQIKVKMVSAKFKNFTEDDGSNKKTIDLAWKLCQKYNMSFDFTNFLEEMNENELRSQGLEYLREWGNFDYVWLVDADEIYEKSQIQNIINELEIDPLMTCWYLHFKNYVFDNQTFIEGTCSPRIFKWEYRGALIHDFFWDCDVRYQKPDGTFISYKNTGIGKIPLDKAWIQHYSWNDPIRSYKKIKYQEEHFKGGFGCSFKWENGKLAFNEEYYSKIGEPIPKTFKDEKQKTTN